MELSVIFVLIVAGAVFCGYFGTKYVIDPIFLGEKEEILTKPEEEGQKNETIFGENEKKERIESNRENVASSGALQEGKANQNTEQTVTLYTLKFGTYSTEENGNQAVADLASKSIYSYPVEMEGEYRIYSLPFCEKSDATAFKDGYLAMGEDCFVVPRSFGLKAGYSVELLKDYVDILKDISQGFYTGVQRQQMAVNILAELKSAYGSGNGQVSSFLDKTAEEAALITGTDNEMLFQLQKTIIMNLSSALV